MAGGTAAQGKAGTAASTGATTAGERQQGQERQQQGRGSSRGRRSSSKDGSGKARIIEMWLFMHRVSVQRDSKARWERQQ
jgi:hypothetical protein